MTGVSDCQGLGMRGVGMAADGNALELHSGDGWTSL